MCEIGNYCMNVNSHNILSIERWMTPPLKKGVVLEPPGRGNQIFTTSNTINILHSSLCKTIIGCLIQRALYMYSYYYRKNEFLQMCGSQIRLCLYTFPPIASKQLNSLTTSYTFSWLSGAVVTHLLWVQEVPGLIPGSGKSFYVWLFVLLLLWFSFLSKNTLFVTTFCNFFCNVNFFIWLIIRV